MRNKGVLLAFVSALLLLATFGAQIMLPGRAAQLDVSPGQSIQYAINSAQPGDTIFVHEGIYHERIEINKTVSLVGENRVTTVVDGGGNGTIIKVTADHTRITGFRIQNSGNTLVDCGVFMGESENVTIDNNIIKNNYCSIELQKTSNSNIIDNILIENYACGIQFSNSSANEIIGNVIAYNPTGVIIMGSTIPNTFYHNNFIDNQNQAYSSTFTYWDNGTEGNYWNDYPGMDADGDGIGDDPHFIDLGTDDYPLTIPTRPFPVFLDDTIYPVALLSNSTVSRFYFSAPLKQIGFNVTGSSGTIGFSNVTIPLTLMWCDQPEDWQVTVGDSSPTYFPTSTNNGTHTFLYFAYNHSTHNVKITSTYVIPEFPAAIVLPLFIIVTLIAGTLGKRRKEALEA